MYSRSHEFEFFSVLRGGWVGGGGEHFWGYPYVLLEISNCKMRIQNVVLQETGYESRQTPKLKPTVP